MESGRGHECSDAEECEVGDQTIAKDVPHQNLVGPGNRDVEALRPSNE
jgi:hypothetical protein